MLLAICDKELAGRTLNGDVDFKISEAFYGKDQCNETRALHLAKKATMINAVGNEIVKLLIKNNFTSEENTICIEDVMHCQIYIF